jgi:hypothetical protein
MQSLLGTEQTNGLLKAITQLPRQFPPLDDKQLAVAQGVSVGKIISWLGILLGCLLCLFGFFSARKVIFILLNYQCGCVYCDIRLLSLWELVFKANVLR